MITTPITEQFFFHLEKRRMTTNLSGLRYLEMREEYKGIVDWWKNVKACIDWNYDRGNKKVSAHRLRNWMRKAIEFQKRSEIKQQQAYRDKEVVETPPPVLEPLWEPPV